MLLTYNFVFFLQTWNSSLHISLILFSLVFATLNSPCANYIRYIVKHNKWQKFQILSRKILRCETVFIKYQIAYLIVIIDCIPNVFFINYLSFDVFVTSSSTCASNRCYIVNLNLWQKTKIRFCKKKKKKSES